jgi:hypothetical protein
MKMKFGDYLVFLSFSGKNKLATKSQSHQITQKSLPDGYLKSK